MYALYWTTKEDSKKHSQMFESRQAAEERAVQLKEEGHLFIDIKEDVEPQNYFEK
ncbi:hypothetical protein JQN58_20190 [Aneurinibacillus sp. BA2021]|nr:hypothetical protein [Aneurinibacillus sp. BA2021]